MAAGMDPTCPHGPYEAPRGAAPAAPAARWPPAAPDGRTGAGAGAGAGSGGAPYALSHSASYAYFGGSAPGAFPGNPYCSAGPFQAFSGQFHPGPPSYVPGPASDWQQEHGAGLQLGERPPGSRGAGESASEDGKAAQRLRDTRWLQRFSRSSARTPSGPGPGASASRGALYRTVRLVRELHGCCEPLKRLMVGGGEWDEAYGRAALLLRELRDQGPSLPDAAPALRAEASAAARRRTLRLRARTQRLQRRRQAEERRSDREAAIRAWRLKRVREVEDKQKEEELKLAADSVLSEVRKKQADVKRMQDVLRSLQKLRSLRKEAACRRGISTERQSDGEFSVRLEQLRSTMRRRVALYSAEEKALMVMLEGKQEGERQRERERRVRREMEQQLQRRRQAHSLLFGEERSADFILQPFTQYYTQAQHSLHALIQIRREWDVFLVPADHPNGSPLPGGWIFPKPPSDHAWASALQPICPPEGP